jgi:hypothetical protein
MAARYKNSFLCIKGFAKFVFRSYVQGGAILYIGYMHETIDLSGNHSNNKIQQQQQVQQQQHQQQ